MNAFGQSPSMPQGAEAMQMMQQEARFYIDFVNKITDQCFRKCVARYHDGELNTGEQACVDRCVSKYFDVRFCHPCPFYINSELSLSPWFQSNIGEIIWSFLTKKSLSLSYGPLRRAGYQQSRRGVPNSNEYQPSSQINRFDSKQRLAQCDSFQRTAYRRLRGLLLSSRFAAEFLARKLFFPSLDLLFRQ